VNEQLELPPKVLAPPQLNPPKPTPTSISHKAASFKYEPRLDSHTYLASIHQETAFAQLTNHVTTSLTVQANIEENDDALIRLQEQMAAMSKGYAKADQAAGPGVLTVIEDPELAKRKAEVAERDRLRAQKRRETQEQRMRDRQSGVLARAGLRNPYASGVGELEGGVPRARKPARKQRRRGSEYSDDEDDYRGGRTREDEYDEDDGFVAGSDEEVEYMEDDEADDLDRGMRAGAAGESDADGDGDAATRAPRSPKRPREEDDEPSGATGAKRGRRQVLDDDDDED
jgi:RNA polymerase-associated protein LEO1